MIHDLRVVVVVVIVFVVIVDVVVVVFCWPLRAWLHRSQHNTEIVKCNSVLVRHLN